MAAEERVGRWKNAIVGYAAVDPATLLPHPHNARQHGPEQLAALEGSLDELGWIQDVIVNETTGHLIDGHARVKKALQYKEPLVPVKYVRLTEEQEALALLTFDPIGAMAHYHKANVAHNMARIQTQNAALQTVVSTLAANNRMLPPGHLTNRTQAMARGRAIATTFDMIFTHTCMQMRGVRATGVMVTSALRGALLHEPDARAEFYALVRRDT